MEKLTKSVGLKKICIMRVPRIYCDDKLVSGASIQLDSETAHYLINVLRLKLDNEINLFNGDTGEFRGVITSGSKKEVVVKINEQLSKPSRSPLYLHLALGLSKGDRMDYAIQKSVELGVAEITPLYTEFNEVRFKDIARLQKKLIHWGKIAIAACEQCGSHGPPTINIPVALNEFLKKKSNASRLVLDKSGDNSLSEIAKSEAIDLVVGPEGGLSTFELKNLQSQGYKVINMGPRILRTETAPIAALAILQSGYGDM